MKILLVAVSILYAVAGFAQEASPFLFEQLKEKIVEGVYPKIDAVIVEHKGSILMEEYFNGFDTDSVHDMRSSFKSVTSLLAGIAIDKGLITLDDRLERFFPELKDDKKGQITVQDLLEMRSGLNCEEFYGLGPECEDEMVATDDWVAYCLAVELVREPGLNWSYNSIDPMLVGEMITRASGMPVMEFAEKNLFQPLGIQGYGWTLSPKGQGMTAGSFYIKPVDMLKIADLVKEKGNWHGKQILSSGWIEQSTACPIIIDYSFVRYSKMPNARYASARYGFFWYREHLNYKNIDTEILFASGNGGQYMMWLPAYDLTVIFTGSNYGNWRGKLPFEMLIEYIIPAVERRIANK